MAELAKNTMLLDILTPLGPVHFAEGRETKGIVVDGAEIPGLLGELGVLPQHVPFITPVVPGVVRFRVDGHPYRLAVGSGFLEVRLDSQTPEQTLRQHGGQIVILVERALAAADVDVGEVHNELKQINASLAKDTGSIDSVEHRKLALRQQWLEAQLSAARS